MVTAQLAMGISVILGLLQSVIVGGIIYPKAGSLDELPTVTSQELPVYPHEALPLKADGKVRMRVIIGREGEVQDARIDFTSNLDAFDRSVVDAIYMWSFTPARRGDQPVSCQAVIPFEFRLPQYAEAKVSMSRLDIAAEPSETLTALEFAPTGLLASGGEYGIVKLWHVDDRKLSLFKDLRGHKGRINTLAFRPDGYQLATGTEDGSLQMWTISEEWELRTLRETGCAIVDLAFSPDGSLLASAGCRLELWSADEGTLVAALGEGDKSYSAVGFSGDGSLVFSVCADGSFEVWGVGDHETARAFGAPAGEVSVVDLHAPSGRAAVGFCDDRIALYSLSDGAPVDTLSGHRGCIGDLEFTQDGRGLISVSEDWGICYWGLDEGSLERTYLQYGHKMRSLAFNHRGDLLSWVAAGDIQLWSVEAEL